MRKQSIFVTVTALGLAISMPFSVQAVQIKDKNCVVQAGSAYDISQENSNNVKKRFNIQDIQNEIYNGKLGDCRIIIYSNCSKPEIDEPETNETETSKPEISETEPGKPDVDKPEINETETSKPESDKPETNETETSKPDTNQPETDKEDKSFAEQVADLVNAERAKAGVSPLTLDKSISSAAAVRTKEIETSFSHTRPDGRKFSTVLTDNGIRFRGAGENIAWGYISPEKVMEAWMNSEGHRANILDPDYKKIGVGYNKNSSGKTYWTQLFTY